MNSKKLSMLKIGQTFEDRGKLYKVCDILRIAGTLYNIGAMRVHKSKGYTFGPEKNFPFRKGY
jgi:hypothetical protein